MVTSKLQEAIAQIKSGNKQGGQKLLAEVISAEPNNENAWLWMSTLVDGDKQKYCLEKALSINPGNIQARQQLERLTLQVRPPVPPQPVAKSITAPVESRVQQPPPAPVVTEAVVSVPERPVQHEILNLQYWVIPNKYMTGIVCMAGNTLLAFDVLPQKAPELLLKIQQETPLKQIYEEKDRWNLTGVVYLSIPRISSVTMFGESIKIVSLDTSKIERRASITCSKETAEPILSVLQQRLGSRFQRITRPISRGKVIASGIVMFVLTTCVTGFFFWLAKGLATETDPITGSARARGIAALLMLLGPNGVLCLGGGILLIVLIAFISSMAKPPEETVLVGNTKTAMNG